MATDPVTDGIAFVTDEEIEAALTDLPTAEAVAWVRTALDTRHTQVAGAYLRDLTPDRLTAERDEAECERDQAHARLARVWYHVTGHREEPHEHDLFGRGWVAAMATIRTDAGAFPDQPEDVTP